MHFFNDTKDSDKLKKMIGDNPLTKEIGAEQEEYDKSEVFEAVDYLEHAAREMYVEDGEDFDSVIGYLAEAIKALKGKENELKKLVPDKKDMAGEVEE